MYSLCNTMSFYEAIKLCLQRIQTKQETTRKAFEIDTVCGYITVILFSHKRRSSTVQVAMIIQTKQKTTHKAFEIDTVCR